MATQSGTFTFSLPEDVNSDTLRIYKATTENGTYSLDVAVSYEYGELSYEFDTLDDTTWYKIQFYNSSDSEAGPESDKVYGGDFSKAAPFLAVSTSTDGANYASIKDVFEYANLTTSDATGSQVSKALKRARAVIDLRTAELDLSRFDVYEAPIARKKYNATLRILKEAEICIALGHLYRGLSDDIIMEINRDKSLQEPSVSIGSTALGDTGQQRLDNVPKLLGVSDRYLSVGAAMLEQIQPSSIRLTTVDPGTITSPRFKRPFNGWR